MKRSRFSILLPLLFGVGVAVGDAVPADAFCPPGMRCPVFSPPPQQRIYVPQQQQQNALAEQQQAIAQQRAWAEQQQAIAQQQAQQRVAAETARQQAIAAQQAQQRALATQHQYTQPQNTGTASTYSSAPSIRSTAPAYSNSSTHSTTYSGTPTYSVQPTTPTHSTTYSGTPSITAAPQQSNAATYSTTYSGTASTPATAPSYSNAPTHSTTYLGTPSTQSTAPSYTNTPTYSTTYSGTPTAPATHSSSPTYSSQGGSGPTYTSQTTAPTYAGNPSYPAQTTGPSYSSQGGSAPTYSAQSNASTYAGAPTITSGPSYTNQQSPPSSNPYTTTNSSTGPVTSTNTITNAPIANAYVAPTTNTSTSTNTNASTASTAPITISNTVSTAPIANTFAPSINAGQASAQKGLPSNPGYLSSSTSAGSNPSGPPLSTASSAHNTAAPQQPLASYSFQPTPYGTVQVSQNGQIIGTMTPQSAALQYGYSPSATQAPPPVNTASSAPSSAPLPGLTPIVPYNGQSAYQNSVGQVVDSRGSPIPQTQTKAASSSTQPQNSLSLTDLPNTGVVSQTSSSPTLLSALGSNPLTGQPCPAGFTGSLSPLPKSNAQTINSNAYQATPNTATPIQTPVHVGVTAPQTIVVRNSSAAADCVSYIKSLGIDLSGHGSINSYSAKQQLANKSLSVAQPGDVAIIKVSGKYADNGHLAQVRSITSNSDGTVSLTIAEGGWTCRTAGCADTRTSTAANLAKAEEQLGITGMYQP